MTHLDETFKGLFFPALEGVGGAEDLVVTIGGGAPIPVKGGFSAPGMSEDAGPDMTLEISMGTATLPLPECAGLARGDVVARVRGDDGQEYKVDAILSRGGGMIVAAVKVAKTKDLYNSADRARRGGGR